MTERSVSDVRPPPPDVPQFLRGVDAVLRQDCDPHDPVRMPALVFTNSGNWFYSTRHSTAELLSARLYGATH